MSWTRRVALAGPCLALGMASSSGCIGIERHVRGLVLHTQTHGCSDVAARTAVSGATVRLECPGADAAEVVTEMGGRFRFTSVRLDADCAIVVTKPGYRKRRYAVPDICVDPVAPGSDCEAASMTAHLVPTRAGSTLEGHAP